MNSRRCFTIIGLLLFSAILLFIACARQHIPDSVTHLEASIERKGFSRYFHYAHYNLVLATKGQARQIEIMAGEEMIAIVDAINIMKFPALVTDAHQTQVTVIAKDKDGAEVARLVIDLPQEIQAKIETNRIKQRQVDSDGYYYYDTSEGFWKFYSIADLTAMSAADRMQIHLETEQYHPKYVVIDNQYTALEDYEENGTEAEFIDLQPPFPQEAFNITQKVSFDPYTQQVIAYDPPTISLVSPGNQTSGHGQIVTLIWEAAPGQRADGQEGNAVQIEQYHLFLTILGSPFPTQPVYISEDKNQKTYTTNLLGMDTTYLWKVKVIQSDGAASTSPERTFTVGNEAILYTLTLQASPTDYGLVAAGGTFEGEVQRFTNWSGMFAEGDEVNIQAIPKSGYQFIHWKQGVSVISEQTVHAYTMPGEDIELIAEFEAIIHEYAPPQIELISPNDNTSDMPNTVTLTWEATPGNRLNTGAREVAVIEAYHVYIGKADQPYPDPLLVTGKEKTIQNLDFNTTYKWKVEAIQTGGAIATSDEWTFTVREEVILYTLTLQASPVNCGSVAAGGNFEVEGQRFASWSGLFAEGDEVNIHAMPAPEYLFIGWKEGQSLVSNNANYTYTMPGGDILLVGEFEAIIYGYDLPEISLIAPNDNESDMATSVTLTWDATPGQLIILNAREAVELTEFRIFFGEDDAWDEPYATVAANAFDESDGFDYPLSELKYGQQYYWTIEAVQSDSKTASPTVRSFTTVPKHYNSPQIALVEPLNGSTNVPWDVTLTWEATPGQQTNISGRGSATIDEYQLYFAPFGQDYPEPIILTEMEQGMELDFDTQYKWKVEVLQSDGATQITQEATFITEKEWVFVYKDGILISTRGFISRAVQDIHNDPHTASDPHVIKVKGGVTLYEPEVINCSFKIATITSDDGQPFTIDMQGNNKAFLIQYRDAKITLENAFVINGKSSYGGAAEVSSTSVFITRNCTFTGNEGVYGGAVYVNNASFYTENTWITENNASASGGGVHLQPSSHFSATQMTISHNTAGGGGGGGIYIYGGGFIGYDCDILNNEAAGSGGGILIRSNYAVLDNSRIVGNVSLNGDGGGVRIGDLRDASFDANNVLIQGNSANLGGGVFIEGTHFSSQWGAQYPKGVFQANEVDITENTAGVGGGIYRSYRSGGAFGEIYTNGNDWNQYGFMAWTPYIAEDFSVKENGTLSDSFSSDDPVTVHGNTATEDPNTAQIRWLNYE